jgi:hypothetical protein
MHGEPDIPRHAVGPATGRAMSRKELNTDRGVKVDFGWKAHFGRFQVVRLDND